jgi:hypothetical protein
VVTPSFKIGRSLRSLVVREAATSAAVWVLPEVTGV